MVLYHQLIEDLTMLEEYVDKKYYDEYLKKNQENIYLKHNVPQSKEGMYYREIFNSY